MTLTVNKIVTKCFADNDLLQQILDQASREYENAFLSDRLAQEMAEDPDISYDCSVPNEEFDCELTEGLQISEQLFNLMQELKLCKASTISEELDVFSNEETLHDLKLQMLEDVWHIPELLADPEEGDFVEQTLERAAKQYEMSFALDRFINEMNADEAEFFLDCKEIIYDNGTAEMYMPTTMSTSSCSISQKLFDMVQDGKNMQVKEAKDLDGVVLDTSESSSDIESELELCMLEDMNSFLPAEALQPETVSRAFAPHPKQIASVRNKTAVTCSLPLACFANARSPYGGMPCGTPKSCGTPKIAAWTPKMACTQNLRC